MLSETKHQTTEVRTELGRLSSKVDELHSKVSLGLLPGAAICVVISWSARYQMQR